MSNFEPEYIRGVDRLGFALVLSFVVSIGLRIFVMSNAGTSSAVTANNLGTIFGLLSICLLIAFVVRAALRWRDRKQTAQQASHTKADLDAVSDNPEWTAEVLRKARPFAEVFPHLTQQQRTDVLGSLIGKNSPTPEDVKRIGRLLNGD